MKTYIWVITSYHFSIWHLMTQAVCRFIWIDWHVQHVWWLHRQESVTQVWAKRPTYRAWLELNINMSQLSSKLEFDWSTGSNLPVFHLFLSGRIFIWTFPSSSPGSTLLSQPPHIIFWGKYLHYYTLKTLVFCCVYDQRRAVTQLTFQTSALCTVIAHF